ncbi:putative reverse transcriptase domain-containing protein [Tanacetum coccineum]
MPPKSAPMTQAAIRRMIKESVDAAIAAERARQANVRNDASRSGPVRGRDTAPAVRKWFEKTKSVFEIIECAEGKKVKFAAATLEGPALTWWKTKVATMGLETVNQMPWTEMKQLMTAKFCPIEEIQRMEHELWNLKINEYDIVAYTQRFNELALMCPRMPADLIRSTYRMAHKIDGAGKSQAKNEIILEGKKRKWENLQQGNARAMVTAPSDGKLPLCERCFTRHVGQCTIKCHKCGKIGHKAREKVKQEKLEKFSGELSTYVIVCGEKVVRIPYGNKTLIVEGDKGGSRLKIILCIKARKYVEQGCHLFLAHVTKSKSKEKRIEDMPIICDFPEVFLEELPGLPPPRQVEFRIDLVPGAAPVARAPYRLAPSEMKELSVQLQELLEKGYICPSSSPWGAPMLFVKKKDGSFRM